MDRTINIFFSWQSDIDNQRKYLEDILRAAARKCFGESYNIIQATSDCVGSTEIDKALFENINRCDIFVADVTTVNNTKEDSENLKISSEETCPNSRHCPNPNVLVETGFAGGQLGWERVILLINEHFESVEALPFDLRSRRAIKFKANKTMRKTVRSTDTIVDEMCKAFQSIVEYFPLRLKQFLCQDSTFAASLKSLATNVPDSTKLYFEVQVANGGRVQAEFHSLLEDRRYGLGSMQSISAQGSVGKWLLCNLKPSYNIVMTLSSVHFVTALFVRKFFVDVGAIDCDLHKLALHPAICMGSVEPDAFVCCVSPN